MVAYDTLLRGLKKLSVHYAMRNQRLMSIYTSLCPGKNCTQDYPE